MAAVELAWNPSRPDPSIQDDGTWLQSGREEQVDFLTDALFSLDEPWRSRFLNLVARIATGSSWHRRQPEREQITGWLRDLRLYRDVAQLLEAWPMPD